MKGFIRSKLFSALAALVMITAAVVIPLSGSIIHTHAQSTVTFTEFNVSTSGSGPEGIAKGPDGNLWFTEASASKIGRITSSGVITEFPLSTPGSEPFGITTGSDGNLWFTESTGNKIGKITPTGTITEYPIPTTNSGPLGITSGLDGNLWFTEAGVAESDAYKIGKITTAGVITEYQVPTVNSAPWGITSGTDGNLWFTEFSGSNIGKITPSGVITEYPIPTTNSGPTGITQGPDNNLWFTESMGTSKISKITTNGTITEYTVPSGSNLIEIAAGSDGNLWFTEQIGNKIGMITTTGTITEYPVPTSNGGPYGITSGPDGNLWFTELNGDKIGRVNLSSPTPTVQNVWTAEGNNNTTTSFTPGDAIQYEAQINNTNGTTVTATLTFLATGPQQIFSWSGPKSVASGTSTITLGSTVPFDARAGQYTLTVTVSYNGVSSQGQSQFTVTRPYNSAVNNLTTDAKYDQSETTIAVSSVNSPGLTVMVAYNDFLRGEGTGYSYSFDGGTRWTDGGTPPVYQDRSGNGANGGDPALTVDKNGTFYLAQIEYTANLAKEFIGMSQCTYLSFIGTITCARPTIVSNSVSPCTIGGLQIANDKPGITYDPLNNRVYVTWTNFTYNQKTCSKTSTHEMLRYYDVSTGQFSTPYTLGSFTGNGTAPVVTSSGVVYVFFLQQTSQGLGKSVVYFTFNNGTIATHPPLANIYPAAQIQSTCGQYQEAFTTQAFANDHYARTNELPTAAVDNSGNIDVVWEAASPFNGGVSTIFVATLPGGGGTPTLQALPNPNHLIQWQPAIAFAGGTNTLAVTYFQVVQLSDGSYQIVREQATAPASSVPTFGAAKMISTVSWNALPTKDDSNSTPCYEGDYSSSVSTPTANVVWSYWGDNRNGSQADVYGLFVNVP